MPWNSGPSATTQAPRSLAWIGYSHLLMAGALSVGILSALCFFENYYDQNYFARWYLQVEVSDLRKQLTATDTGIAFHAADRSNHFRGPNAGSYGYRIWDQSHAIVASSNPHLLDAVSPFKFEGTDWPDSWQRTVASQWFHTAGGARTNVQGIPLWIEVATTGDPAGRRFKALAADYFNDVLKPTVPTVFFATLLAMLSLRRTANRLTAAETVARKLSPTDRNLRIPIDGLPREVATLASTINKLLARMSSLIEGQGEFMGRAAHQLRTPIGVMMLEAGRSDNELARKFESDLTQMGVIVERMLELAKLQAVDDLEREPLDLVDIAEDVLLELSPLLAKHSVTTSIKSQQPVPIDGEFVLTREAVRNVVTNAILHHPGQAVIQITCGPGPILTIDDDGQGMSNIPPKVLFAPFHRGTTTVAGSGLGLAIVKQIMDLHNGTVEIRTSDSGGASVRLNFEAA